MISYDIDYMWSSNKCYKWTYRSWVIEVTTIMLDQAVKAVITFCICLNTHTFSYLRTFLLRPLSSAKNLPRSECYRILSLILKISTIYQQQRRLSWCSVNSPLLCFKKKKIPYSIPRTICAISKWNSFEGINTYLKQDRIYKGQFGRSF